MVPGFQHFIVWQLVSGLGIRRPKVSFGPGSIVPLEFDFSLFRE